MSSLLIRDFNQSSLETMIELSKEEQAHIIAGEMCTYQGTTYSPGSTETMPKMENGRITETVKECQPNGTWK
jgi:hypothetical protein